MSTPRAQPGPRHRQQEPLSPLPWLLAGLALLVAAVLALGLVNRGWFRITVFDETAVQQGVQRVLTGSGYAVGSVSCPTDQPVEAGRSFTCRATVDGDLREVRITVRTDGGVYEVAAPGP
ncbi:MAG: DUF4333 domain-containing protein [Pseudonocardiaceae bacterium]|nr:DUF4333 domain-containing protein [Pseudonocardiaceae bacterium]